MMRKLAMVPVASLLLGSCVSGPPTLTAEQHLRVDAIPIIKRGEPAPRPFKVREQVRGVDCTAGQRGTRLYGEEASALRVLRMKAAALGADAVVDVECGSTPFLNNCWRAANCSGKAVQWSGD
jgi:hypothetical protein